MSAKKRAAAILGVVLGFLLTSTSIASSSEAAPGYTEGASISLNASVIQCHGAITVAGQGFAPGEAVTLTLHTETVTLTTVHADGDGAFSVTVTVPDGIDGVHTIVATGTSGDFATASARVTIETCRETQGGGTSNTGVAIMAIGGVGIVLLGLGTLLVIGARRRRSLV